MKNACIALIILAIAGAVLAIVLLKEDDPKTSFSYPSAFLCSDIGLVDGTDDYRSATYTRAEATQKFKEWKDAELKAVKGQLFSSCNNIDSVTYIN